MNHSLRVFFHSVQRTKVQRTLKSMNDFSCMVRRLLSQSSNKSSFPGNKIVLLSKTTRFEFECATQPDLNEKDFNEYLVSKGSDYHGLLHRHKIHKENVRILLDALRSRGFDVEVVDRSSYNEFAIAQADAIFTAGGDGTFLLAASRISDRNKPVIGFNTDVERSEGRLLLPAKYSLNPGDALDNLLDGRFSWQWRQRIRITTSGRHRNDSGMELHELQFRFPEFRYSEHVGEHEEVCSHAHTTPLQPERELPVRALNEVFVGESLSARVSYYEMSIDGGEASKQKSSGVTLCTGTGSTSWYFHINHLSQMAVELVLSAARTSWPALRDSTAPSGQVIKAIRDIYNSHLRFGPEEERMAFCVRDPLISRVFSVAVPRGFAKRMTIRSRMWDGQLVIDGGTVFHFNDGAIATFQMFSEDALKCVLME